MYPTLLCVLFILSFIICLKIGIPSEIEKWKFQKHLAAYNKIVDSIQNGNISCSSTITAINTTNLPPGIRNILAVQCPDKSLFVMFIGNGSSFAGHAGYIYKNYTETNNCISENTKLEENENLQPIIGNWYKFYDAD